VPRPRQQPGQETASDRVLEVQFPGDPAGLLVGQPPCRRVERRPVVPQAQRTARGHVHPVGVPETPGRARLAPDPEVGPVAVDDPLHGGGHRSALRLERGEQQVPALRQGSEVTAIGCGRPARGVFGYVASCPGHEAAHRNPDRTCWLVVASGWIGHTAGVPLSSWLAPFHHRHDGWNHGAAVMETGWTWPGPLIPRPFGSQGLVPNGPWFTHRHRRLCLRGSPASPEEPRRPTARRRPTTNSSASRETLIRAAPALSSPSTGWARRASRSTGFPSAAIRAGARPVPGGPARSWPGRPARGR
jgi:hypothetical protein